MKKLITCESVTIGHPDKVCDKISDSILDEILEHDSKARVACETAISDGIVMVMGEITSQYKPDYINLVKNTIKDIGYTDWASGFDVENCSVVVNIKAQSPDISMGVNKALESKKGALGETLGAGDQGIVYGYASNESKNYMPIAFNLATRLTKQLEFVRRSGQLSYLRPDGKSLVSFDELSGKVDTIIVSCQHHEDICKKQIENDILKNVILKVIPIDLLDGSTNVLINPTGKFSKGGPNSDAGVTGRKLMVDTYGGVGRHGGGAFSGKDPTKVDRSGAYMARYIAKNIVASGVCDKCEVAISYIIGVARPASININTFGTSRVDERRLEKIAMESFDLTPQGIINTFGLENIRYSLISSYGHFGRDEYNLPWEKLDKLEKFRNL